ncbi:MAG: putative DNA binding domain-containing protein [Desulfobacteraceae bacterium]|nr:putative DNA binding domain-containing protein [Desulfobacteraceae bacterium]MCB9493976.1 putative DNA binding domain-containing protein [Desulfobacteraceae bacterium]
MKPHVDIKSFLKFLIFIVAVLVLAVSVFSIVQINSVKRQTISAVMESTLEKADIEMTLNLDSINSNLEIAKSWGDSGLIKIEDEDALQSQFVQLLRQYKNIAALCVVNEKGDSAALIKKDSSVDMVRKLGERIQQWQIDSENNRTPVTLTFEIEDLRKTGWYKNAVTDGKGVFTQSHMFSENSTGSLAMPYSDKVEGRKGVVMFEITMDEITSGDTKSYLHKKNHIFLFSPSGHVVTLLNTLTMDEKITEQQKQLMDKIFENSKSLAGNRSFSSYLIGDEVWWTGILRSEKNSNVLIGMITPESELVPEISSGRYKWYAVLSGVIVVGALFFAALIRTYRRTVLQLDQLHQRETKTDEERILDLISQGESANLEFKSTVRFNLKSGKNGREIEHAWLKNVAAFLNSNGGSVLIGVADDGEVLGLEPDNFASQDKCILHVTNLIKQCIGTEFHSYLNINIHTVQGKEVVEIRVEPSRTPAYLTQNKEEEFFIRSGPSCSRLTVSQAVNYILERQKH